MHDMTDGVELWYARRRAGFTIKAAASLVNVTPKTVSSWERGETDLPASALLEFSRAYNVPMDRFILPYGFGLPNQNPVDPGQLRSVSVEPGRTPVS